MKSDAEIYKIFKSETNALFELTGTKAVGKYDFKSVSVKAIAREMDGLLEPELPGEPHYVVEFQNQDNEQIYDRIILEMACLGLEHPENIYHGILIFGNSSLDKKRKPWRAFAETTGKEFRVFYLDELLKKFAESKPDHPLVAVFYPFIEANLKELEKKAALYYTRIKESDLSDASKEEFFSVFIEWLSDRFKYKTKQEIKAMLPEMCAFEETQCYQDILMEGKVEGKIEGSLNSKRSELEKFENLRAQGALSEEVFHVVVSPLKAEIESLEKKLTSLRQ